MLTPDERNRLLSIKAHHELALLEIDKMLQMGNQEGVSTPSARKGRGGISAPETARKLASRRKRFFNN